MAAKVQTVADFLAYAEENGINLTKGDREKVAALALAEKTAAMRDVLSRKLVSGYSDADAWVEILTDLAARFFESVEDTAGTVQKSGAPCRKRMISVPTDQGQLQITLTTK